jgi:primosomal protein N' (replication factor Y)
MSKTFKQWPCTALPCRDAAVLATYYKAITLGSATPSIETYFNAISNKFGLVTIKERYGKSLMPEIELVDLPQILETNDRTFF